MGPACGSIPFMLNPKGRHLNLWKHGLGSVPESVWDETELETLVLADNGLYKVSERIGALKKLRMLDLGHNERANEAIRDAGARYVLECFPALIALGAQVVAGKQRNFG